MHEFPVPKEAKREEENEGNDECDEEFFPVHNFFRLRFLLLPPSPGTFIAKPRPAVDVKFYSYRQGTTPLPVVVFLRR
ncbi:MAG: hypothetical protein DME96_00295 [Verrucomicrobia bacterium]|nr:MAG: hypothetical protein DME96_00295 [Verrucomicrobiota bacterium]